MAFGTDEGRVGIFDTLHSAKAPLLSRTYHKGTVYNLAWAPLLDENESALFLYSCGGHHMFIHDAAKLEAEAKNFNRILSVLPDAKKSQQYPSRTEFQWKADYSLLAVGNEDGSVEIYSGSNLCLLTIIVAHKKLIQCLRWHPSFTFQSPEASECGNWLAIASNETSIKGNTLLFLLIIRQLHCFFVFMCSLRCCWNSGYFDPRVHSKWPQRTSSLCRLESTSRWHFAFSVLRRNCSSINYMEKY